MQRYFGTRLARRIGAAVVALLILATGVTAATALFVTAAGSPGSASSDVQSAATVPAAAMAAGEVAATLRNAVARALAPVLAAGPAVAVAPASKPALARPAAPTGAARIVAGLVAKGIVPAGFSVGDLRALARRAGGVVAAIRALAVAHASGRTLAQVLAAPRGRAWGPVYRTTAVAARAAGGTAVGGGRPNVHRTGYHPLGIVPLR